MSSYPTARAVRVVEGVKAALDDHASKCGDRVQAIALNETDLDELRLVEISGIRIWAWEDVEPGRFKLLCEDRGILVPEFDTFEQLQDHWTFGPQPAPVPSS